MTHGYREIAPPPALAGFVECFWTARRTEDGLARILPDGCADLIINADANVRFVSTMSAAALLPVSPRRIHAVRFTPGGAAALLGAPMAELVDWAGPWSDLGLRASFDSGAEQVVLHGSFGGIASTLMKLRPEHSSRQSRDAAIAQRVARSGESVAAVANVLSLSRQHLARCVKAATGLTPKHLSRIGRLRRLVDGLPDLGFGADAAVTAGYYDQAHMTNEFRSLVGTTPQDYLQQRAAG